MAFESQDHATAYWKENLSLMLKLLFVWALVSFGFGIFFVDVLNNIQFFGFKLGFWFAQQGAIYTFIVLIFIYIRQMGKLDKKHGVEED